MTLPSRAKTAQYWKALPIGAGLFLFQAYILTNVIFSRTLGADTLHALLDVSTLLGTTILFSLTWTHSDDFARWERWWLLVGCWSLALGGIVVGCEAVLHVSNMSVSATPPAWPLLLTALTGAMGNGWMHHILDEVANVEHDHLHKNNLDHVFWDMILSLSVFVSGCSMWLFDTMAIDSGIAIIVGFFILPYFAWKRWNDAHNNVHQEHTEHHQH